MNVKTESFEDLWRASGEEDIDGQIVTVVKDYLIMILNLPHEVVNAKGVRRMAEPGETIAVACEVVSIREFPKPN